MRDEPSGLGEHAPERVLSLAIGGQQPYSWPDSPLVRLVTEALAAGCAEGAIEPLMRTFEQFWDTRFPGLLRMRWLMCAASWSASPSTRSSAFGISSAARRPHQDELVLDVVLRTLRGTD